MRSRELLVCLAIALLVSACGPGAGDHALIPNSEAEIDFARGVMWQKPDHLGARLDGQWRCTGACATSAPSLPDTPDGELRSTFGPAGDADTGDIVWAGKIPAGVSTIAVPITRGPSDFAPRIQVSVDFGPAFDLPRAPGNWRYWRVHVKEGDGERRITIRASDAGKDPGEWVALGSPRVVD